MEEKRTFETGATRSKDVAGQKGRYPRFDLVSPIGLRRLAERYSLGAEKNGEHNWRKGMPGSDLLNHSINHLFQYLLGDRSDDHLAAGAWGIFAVMEQEELRAEFNDFWTPEGAESLPLEPIDTKELDLLVETGLRK